MKANNFVVVEGFDGSGKTSTAKWMEETLGYTYTKSPTGVFAKARELFDDIEKVSIVERLAFYTGDCIRLSESLREAGKSSKIVLDRYYPSTACYHEALSAGSTVNILPIFNSLLQPDLILYLKTDYDVIVERLKNRENSLNDNLISEEFYVRVETEFLKFKSLPGFFEIDNNGTPEDTRAQIERIVASKEGMATR